MYENIKTRNISRKESIETMQKDLYSMHAENLIINTISDKCFSAILYRLNEIEEFKQIQIWIIGSLLCKKNNANDIDLLFTRRDKRPLSLKNIEKALYLARWIGIYEFGISIDPVFRNTESDTLAGLFKSDDMPFTWKLESPRIARAIQSGFIEKAIRCSRYLVLFKIEAEYNNYFLKLPHPDGDKSWEHRFLRPGVSMETCLQYYDSNSYGWPPEFS